jgi:hypothetical protein
MRLSEILEQELLPLFKASYKDIKSLHKRDKCEQSCKAFMEWANSQGLTDVAMIKGIFVADRASTTKSDFSKFVLQEMRADDVDINNANERLLYARQHDMLDELKQITHYWCEVNGKLIDVSGQEQFLETGLAVNLNRDRYIEQQRNTF